MKINLKQWRSMSADERIKLLLTYVPDAFKSEVKLK